MYEIEFYDTQEGKCPVQDFLDSLEPKMLAKTLKTIDLLEINGPALREPYSASMGNGLFELRTKQGSNLSRILYFLRREKGNSDEWIYQENTKTPRSDLRLAGKYKADYEQRKNNEQL